MSNVDPTQLKPTNLANLLTKAGGVKIPLTRIQQDIDAGAPTNADGTLHLIHYTAWLIAQTG